MTHAADGLPMSLRHQLLMCLLGLVALTGAAAAQAPCPECDADGEPDESRYSSVDSGVLTDEGGFLVDTDQSVGENQHGRFTWFQYCLKVFDALGHSLVVTYEAFVSEDGADVDGSVSVDGEEVANFDDSPAGELDDETWYHMDEIPAELPVRHGDLPHGVDVDRCLDLREPDAPSVAAEVAASCEIEA